MPEIIIDASTTTLRPRRSWLSFNSDLWLLTLFVSVLSDGFQNFLCGDISHVLNCLSQTGHDLFPPPASLPCLGRSLYS